MLAAGSGRRFGGDGRKLLADWRGRPVLAHVLAVVTAAREAGLVSGCLVVHAPGAAEIRRLARAAGAVPVYAIRADEGIGASLRAGVASLGRADAALILLGDQPAVRVEVIRALVAAAAPALSTALTRPRYGDAPDRPGHPVLLGADHWPLVARVSGDRGLDPVIRAAGLTWAEVDVDGTNPDVDRPEDLLALH